MRSANSYVMTVILSKYKHSKNAFKTVLGRSEAEKNSFLVLTVISSKYIHSKNAFKNVLGRSEAEKNSFLCFGHFWSDLDSI